VKNLLTRTITGTLFVGLIILALTLGYNYLFLGVFASISVLALAEFYGLTQQQKSITLITDIYGGMALFFGMTYATYYGGSLICFSPYLLYILLRFVIQLYSKEADPLKNWAYSFMGQIYVALPLAIICAIYNLFGAHILLALFIFIWVNDTGAFCVGCTFGKHRLFERISPKKSWEGFFGGLFFCIVAAIIFSLCFPLYFTGLTLTGWIVLGILTSIFATWGDLCESLIKRTLNVKDSGKLLPGHGGILDRIDSLLLVSPMALLYLIINYVL
jgi:cytidylyltransferase family